MPEGAAPTATLTIAGQPVAVKVQQAGAEVRLDLEKEIVVAEGSAVEVTLSWA